MMTASTSSTFVPNLLLALASTAFLVLALAFGYWLVSSPAGRRTARSLIPKTLVPFRPDDPAAAAAAAAARHRATLSSDQPKLNRKQRRKQGTDASAAARATTTLVDPSPRPHDHDENDPQDDLDHLAHRPPLYLSLTPPPSGSNTTVLTFPDLPQKVYHWHSPPTLAAPSTLTLSVIIPAFNESARLPAMLDETLTYLSTVPSLAYELVVVDDGSTDSTLTCALAWAAAQSTRVPFTLLQLPRNCGKGAAVKQGIMHARGQLVLFADADGATRFADVHRLVKVLLAVNDREVDDDDEDDNTEHRTVGGVDALWAALASTQASDLDAAIILGSRAHLVTSDAVVKRSFIRNLLMYGFHWILHVLAGPLRGIGDTQCGFKLLTRKAARKVVPGLHVTGWIFDIELLLRAVWNGVEVREVMVTWHEVEGSKMSLVKDAVKMLVDLVWVRVMYAVGFWKV